MKVPSPPSLTQGARGKNSLYALAAILGGGLWILLNLALVGAWDRGDAFPTYEFINGARPLPLAFLAFALYGVFQTFQDSLGRAPRAGFFVALAGFAMLAAGAALEFWIGGGVRDGVVDTLSLAGWLIYLAGYFVLCVGLILFGVGIYRSHAWGEYSILPLLTGLVWAAWFPSILIDQAMQTGLADLSQLIFGGLWIAMGVIMVRQRQKSPQAAMSRGTEKQ